MENKIKQCFQWRQNEGILYSFKWSLGHIFLLPRVLDGIRLGNQRVINDSEAYNCEDSLMNFYLDHLKLKISMETIKFN